MSSWSKPVVGSNDSSSSGYLALEHSRLRAMRLGSPAPPLPNPHHHQHHLALQAALAVPLEQQQQPRWSLEAASASTGHPMPPCPLFV